MVSLTSSCATLRLAEVYRMAYDTAIAQDRHKKGPPYWAVLPDVYAVGVCLRPFLPLAEVGGLLWCECIYFDTHRFQFQTGNLHVEFFWQCVNCVL